MKSVYIAGALLLVTGCTATPLYQPSQTPSSVDAVYAKKIEFAAPNNRVDQLVRNKIIFQLFGGRGEPSDASLKATVKTTTRSRGVFRTNTTSSGNTSASLVTVTGTLSVIDTTTGSTIAEYKRSAIAPIDRGNQQFANERALLDAENRAAEQLGEQFAALLASRVLK